MYVHALHVVAAALLHQDRPAEALERADQSLTKPTSDAFRAVSIALRAASLHRLGRSAEALSAAREAIALYVERTDAERYGDWLGLLCGDVLCAEGAPDEAGRAVEIGLSELARVATPANVERDRLVAVPFPNRALIALAYRLGTDVAAWLPAVAPDALASIASASR
jgi:hypothetical protein